MPDDDSVELRIALAMRGGVSLAVWIGGACAEVDALRRSLSGGASADTEFYGHLARFAGYSEVTVDVMAGASAGGLNAAFLASAIVYGADVEQLREVWIDLADIDALVHEPGDSSVTSLLRGNEYFLKELEAQLTELTAGEWQSPRSLDVLLAATLLSPARVYARQGDDVTVESRAAAYFHFHAGAEPWLNVFEYEGQPRLVASKLALAGRATSSFPAAFEPAAVSATRPESFAAGAAGPAAASDPGGGVPMWGVFSLAQTRAARGPFLVTDGGVLDNIPIAQAINAIARARAHGPTDRVLLFMHPSPGAVDTTEKPGDASLIGVLQATTATRLSQESILDDLGALESFNGDARAYHGARTALLAALRRDTDADVVDGIIWSAVASLDAWRAAATAADAHDIRRLLEDPIAVLGIDRFPDAAMTNPLDTASPPISAAQRRELFETLEREIRRRHEASPLEPSTGGLARVERLARTLRVAVQSFERHAKDAATVKRLGVVKSVLYSVTLASETFGDVGALAWPTLAATQSDALRRSPSRWAIDTMPVVQRLVERHDATLVALLVSDLNGCFVRTDIAAAETPMCTRIAELTGDALAHLDAVIAGRQPTTPDDDIVAMLWSVLETAAVAIGETADDIDLDVSSHGPVAQLFRSTSDHTTTERLCALDVVLLPLALVAPPGDREIRFVRVAGTNPTPLAEWFTKLRQRDDEAGVLRVSRKLAGNQLGNFSAFLRPEYRANDWMWGRVDSAHALLGILLDPRRTQARLLGGTSIDELLEALRRAASAPVVARRRGGRRAVARARPRRPARAGDAPGRSGRDRVARGDDRAVPAVASCRAHRARAAQGARDGAGRRPDPRERSRPRAARRDLQGGTRQDCTSAPARDPSQRRPAAAGCLYGRPRAVARRRGPTSP